MNYSENCRRTGWNHTIRRAVCSRTGARHLREQKESEDAIQITENPSLYFYGIADGQSGKPGGKLGGQESLKALEAYLRKQGVDEIWDYPFPDELPCMLMREVRKALLALVRNRGGSFTDYASTLLVMAVDPSTGRYVLLHLGDGCVVAVPKDREAGMLSTPQNGLTGRETWLTTSENAVPHFRVAFGTLETKSRILLMSDGADSLCRGKHILRQARELICAGSPEEIGEYLKRMEPADDASCIVLDIG